MESGELQHVLEKASVPEHSAAFMRAMSGGEPFLEGPYLFVAAEDWLLAMGYPLEDEYRAGEFEKSLSRALQRTGAGDCWAICPDLPQRLKPHCCNRDSYYILTVDTAPPPRLDRLARRAAACLKVEESTVFTASHRRLWAEFIGRKELPPNVRELYARTESVLSRAPGLSLLNAWESDGNLAVSLDQISASGCRPDPQDPRKGPIRPGRLPRTAGAGPANHGKTEKPSAPGGPRAEDRLQPAV